MQAPSLLVLSIMLIEACGTTIASIIVTEMNAMSTQRAPKPRSKIAAVHRGKNSIKFCSNDVSSVEIQRTKTLFQFLEFLNYISVVFHLKFCIVQVVTGCKVTLEILFDDFLIG